MNYPYSESKLSIVAKARQNGSKYNFSERKSRPYQICLNFGPKQDQMSAVCETHKSEGLSLSKL